MSTGRPYLAIPGPSVIPDQVLTAMHRASPDIYAPEVEALAAGLQRDLKTLAGTRHDLAMYITNGHGAWEAALANLFSPGDHLLVLANRQFGLGWAGMGKAMGLNVEVIDMGHLRALDPARLEERLRADSTGAIKAVLCVQTDTASSAKNDIPALRAAIDAARHPALFAVDCIASFGCDEFHMDAWGVDLMVAACQKGLMTPPGLGFVFFNDKADARRDHAALATNHWDWRMRAAPDEFWQYWHGTPPTHHLFGLRAALDMILDEGIPQVWARHQRFARAYWAALSAFGEGGAMRMNIANAGERSHAVTSVFGGPDSHGLRGWMQRETGVTLGVGLGMADARDPARETYFRIGHMGHVNAHMVLGVIGALEAALIALKLPHGEGASRAAARVIAGID